MIRLLQQTAPHKSSSIKKLWKLSKKITPTIRPMAKKL
jgi:hypothetical protein